MTGGMKAVLSTAALTYGPGVALHTASSGAIPHLSALYLRLTAPDGMEGLGEVRTNIAYLNGYEEAVVLEAARVAVVETDWSRPAELLLAELDDRGWIAPVRTLVDCALHDLLARRAGVTIARWLGARWLGAEDAGVTAWPTNQTLFWSGYDALLANAERYVTRGFADLKLRVGVAGFDEDLRRLAALRDRFGDRIKLAVDANGAWSAEEAPERLAALARHGVAYAEQPIAAGDWDAIARLGETSPVPVMLDESVAGDEAIDRVIALGGRAKGKIWAHLKLVKMGGIGPTVAAARRLSAAGVPFMIGQMNEGAGATAATLQVAIATRPRFAELYGADGLTNDPVAGLTYADGSVAHGGGPGLGVTFTASTSNDLLEIAA
ncbi:mandelate racemase/muconate lactonizing enzyme family protein [Azospirillum canadense]|uniref:mandelate racemase/muconate lactonizing enzyme family protein n=1 Tax=Azospirillum canadense TaxID=403962 RepID=UPI0022261F44|nr:mandelate racemase/muconate lactonizing enzyme family protein [Azospirillum canadense]MCW2241732.1 L-alanine-DL-glutamate epimerase-like enolase superfamily enzyme [Azospirillum canadense]